MSKNQVRVGNSADREVNERLLTMGWPELLILLTLFALIAVPVAVIVLVVVLVKKNKKAQVR